MTEHARTVLSYIEEISSILTELSRAGIIQEKEISLWRQQLHAISDAIQGRTLRIAVVGAVKSGKSTLVNAFLGDDLLRRGAGIVTSCVTRIRSTGGEKGGWIEFKSWKEVNDDITKTYQDLSWLDEKDFPSRDRLDIRSEKDRELLFRLIEKVKQDYGVRRPDFDSRLLLLESYLKGYEHFSNMLDVDSPVKRIFNDISLPEHRLYVGSEDLWAYARDVELFFPIPWLGEGAEIADCQGSDSPNPAHFAQIQDYLIRCHGVVYVIQSRVGLREADFRMLDVIKKFGLLPVTVVVLNVDIGEHESADELSRLLDRVKRDLAWFGANIPVYTVSAIAEMVRAVEDNDTLREKEKNLVHFWAQNSPQLDALSERNFFALKDYIRDNILNSSEQEFLKGCQTRIEFLASQIRHNLYAFHEMLDLDVETINARVKDLRMFQEVLKSTLDTFDKTVTELSSSMVEEARQGVLSFFDSSNSPLVREILDSIENYQPSGIYEIDDFKAVVKRLYEFYLDVREEIGRIIAEKANGKIFEFAKAQEKFVSEKLFQTFQTFMSMFRVALESYRVSLLEKMGVRLDIPSLDVAEFWLPSSELFPPSFSGFIQQQSLGRGALIMKFALGKTIEKLSKLRDALGRKRYRKSGKSRRLDTREEAVYLVKNEIRAEVEEAFEWYGEKYLREYLMPLIDKGISWLIREIRLRAETSVVDFQRVVDLVTHEGEKVGDKKLVLQNAINRVDNLFPLNNL